MSRSITHRLLISNLLILVAFLGLAGAALDRAFRNSAETAVREQLQAHVYTLLTAAQEDERGHMRLPSSLAAPGFNQPDSGLYAEIRGDSGTYHWRSGSMLGRPAPLVEDARPGETRFHITAELAIFTQGVAWEDNRGEAIDYALSVAITRGALDAELASFRGTLWRWLGGVALLLLVAQVLAARWGLAPLHDMSAAVQRIEAGEATMVEGPVARELDGLSNNLNSLIEQNRRRQERVRNSLADLAHSMKTPLAVLRGTAEQNTDPALCSLISEQTTRIDEIVSYQRQRAAVAGASSVTRPILLAPILRRLCASLDKVHRDRAVQCSLRVPPDLQIRADEGDLFELLGNLLENAYKHCHTRVSVSATLADDRLHLDVEDDGEGFRNSDISRLLQRGERADQRHPGEGIGLAVVSEIVRQYRGELQILSADPGGARVRITLPG